jgi:hypothetical protein
MDGDCDFGGVGMGAGADSGPGGSLHPIGFAAWLIPGLLLGGWLSGILARPFGKPPFPLARPAPAEPPRPRLDLWLRCQACASLMLPEFHACPRCGGRLLPAECEHCGQALKTSAGAECAACGAPIR